MGRHLCEMFKIKGAGKFNYEKFYLLRKEQSMKKSLVAVLALALVVGFYGMAQALPTGSLESGSLSDSVTVTATVLKYGSLTSLTAPAVNYAGDGTPFNITGSVHVETNCAATLSAEINAIGNTDDYLLGGTGGDHIPAAVTALQSVVLVQDNTDHNFTITATPVDGKISSQEADTYTALLTITLVSP